MTVLRSCCKGVVFFCIDPSVTVHMCVHVCAYTGMCISCREMIISRFAPEYFPHIPPSVEYMAEDVPVPIPKSENNMLAMNVHVANSIITTE